MEAKSTRHPKSVAPRPLREPAPRPGYQLHFDPFGPFPERLADGSFYGLLFADAYSTVLWFDTLPSLKDWFVHLKALILKIEADKGSERVVAQLASDSAPMFKNSFEYRRYAESKGIALLFSAPYTQKFNAPVERPIRTLVDMAVAMARHANTPKRFMHLAMKFAVRLLNRLFRRMPDGSTDVPLWRYKGTRVSLTLIVFTLGDVRFMSTWRERKEQGSMRSLSLAFSLGTTMQHRLQSLASCLGCLLFTVPMAGTTMRNSRAGTLVPKHGSRLLHMIPLMLTPPMYGSALLPTCRHRIFLSCHHLWGNRTTVPVLSRKLLRRLSLRRRKCWLLDRLQTCK